MASLLFILLIFIFVVLILLLSFGTYVLSRLFGGFINLKNFVCRLMGWNTGKASSSQSSSKKTQSKTSSAYTKSQEQSSAPQGKMFDKDEGTYIDFEEVK